MTEPTESTRSEWPRLAVVLATAAAVVALAEWGSSRVIQTESPDVATEITRPANVIVVPKVAADLPPAGKDPSVWLLGNSQTYTVASATPGVPWRTAPLGIAIDELAACASQGDAATPVNYYLLAYPNFLPFEMLSRVGHLLAHGHRPNVVFLALTWRNIARDSQLRHEVYKAYYDAEFADNLERVLSDANVAADAAVLEEIDSQRARVTRDRELERMRSDSDRLDEALTNWVSSRLTLMERSSDLRAHVFRLATNRVQELWNDRQSAEFSYDWIQHDLDFNLKCLRALVRLLKANGATVVCYFAPERTDLPPLMDPARQQEFMADFSKEAEELGAIVLDARGVVPNEEWGWLGDSPDRSHFTEAGHKRLAQFLCEEAAKRSIWKGLERP